LLHFACNCLDSGRAEGDGNVAGVAIVGDPFDQQLDDTGLFARSEAVPHGVEVGKRRRDLGLVEHVSIERRQFAIDLADAPLGLVETIVRIGQPWIVGTGKRR
jgi:hypothetical protein